MTHFDRSQQTHLCFSSGLDFTDLCLKHGATHPKTFFVVVAELIPRES